MKLFISALMQCTLSMSIITLLYSITLPILSKRYAPKWCYTVWMAIAFAWMIPFRPHIELPFLPVQNVSRPIIQAQVAHATPDINTAMGVSVNNTNTVSTVQQLSMWEIGFFLWLTGVILILIYHIWRHYRFMKMVGRWCEAETTTEVLQLLEILRLKLKISSKIEYKSCPNIKSPMMIGFFHPVILMPPIHLSENELTLVLQHELTHFKRHDLWYKAVILMATLIHWFNPVVYIMARGASVQCEISCDYYVLENEDMKTRRKYGETILAIIRGERTHQTALSTNFYGGKQGMKDRITSMLDGKRKKAGVAILCIVLAGIILTGATLVSAGSRPMSIPNTSFTEEEYDKLLALHFDGYEDMTVSEFQNKVWTARDAEGYMELLDRFYHDEQIDSLKDTNPIAAFLHYELVPLTAENWKSRYFSNGIISNHENATSNAQFEYTCTLSISDANSLTVKEYSQARKWVMDELMKYFKGQPVVKLQDEFSMIKAIESKIISLTNKWKSDALTIQVEYHFIPLEIYEGDEINIDNKVEEREYPNGTEKDYNSLLQLKTKDYLSMTLVDFNDMVLDWANKDHQRSERIGGDIAWNDFAVTLKDDELSFIKVTYQFSGLENARKIRSYYTGILEDPTFGGAPLRKEEGSSGNGFSYCSLYYQMSYHIPDMERITVGERDRCVGGVIHEIDKFWSENSMDKLLSMREEDVSEKLSDFAKQYSNNLITINFKPTKEWFGFEKIDERNIK